MPESELNNKVAGGQVDITCLCPAAYTGSRCEVELKWQNERKWILSQQSNHTSVHLTPSMGIARIAIVYVFIRSSSYLIYGIKCIYNMMSFRIYS